MKLCLDQGGEQRINVAIKVQNTRDNVLPTENVLMAMSLVLVMDQSLEWPNSRLLYQNIAMPSDEIML